MKNELPNINLKKETLNVIFGVIYVIFLLFIIRYFHLNKWGVIGVLCLSSTVLQVFFFIKKRNKFNLKGLLKGYLFIILLVWFYSLLGRFKWLGFFGTCLIMTFIILWKRKAKYLQVKHYIEARIWGKPLYKYREAGKKPPKLEIGF